MSDAPRLASELGRALTGQELPLRGRSTAALVGELAELGFDSDRLQSLRHEALANDGGYPFPADPQAVREIGFARFHAALADLRDSLGLASVTGAHAARDKAWGAEERRLAAERPPHWG